MQMQTKKQLVIQLLQKYIRIKIQYLNFRIRNMLVITTIIAMRILFGTFLNIALLTSVDGKVFQEIGGYWLQYMDAITGEEYQLVGLGVCGLYVVVFVGCYVWIIMENKRIIYYFISVMNVINPIIVRYFTSLLLTNSRSTLNIPIKILSILCIIFGLLNTIFIWIISYSPKTKNENLLICQKKIEILIKQIISFILIIVVSAIDQIAYENTVIFTIVIVLHTLLAILTIRLLCIEFLYHSENVQFIFIIVTAFQVAICVIGFISLSIRDELYAKNAQFVTLILALFLFWGINQYIGYRNNFALVGQLNNVRDFKIFLHIVSDSLTDKVNGINKLQIITNTLKSQHQDVCDNIFCICKSKKKGNDYHENLQKMLIKDKVDAVMSKFTQVFQLTISCCYFKLNFFQTFPDLLHNLYILKTKKSLKFSQILEYECFKTQIRSFVDKKRVQSDAILTERIQQQDQLIIYLATAMRDVSSIKYDFWISLSKRVPQVSILNQIVKIQLQLINQIQDKIPKIMQHFQYSRILLQFISIYQIYVKLKSTLSAQIKAAFKNLYVIKNQYIKIFKAQHFNINTVMFQKTCVIFQSKIDKDNMGMVLNTSKNINEVFGFRKQEIIQHNINEIMPKSMQKQHDAILECWRQRGSWENIHKIRYIYAMTKDHVCFSTAIYIRIVQRFDSINLLATVFKGNVNDFLIVNQDGIIDGLGNNFRKYLGVQIAKLPFSAICDNYQQIIKNTKRFNCKKTGILHLYHTKGLEQLVESFQFNQYMISKNQSQKSKQLFQQIKTKDRRLNISVQYQPYNMGSKTFIIFKFLGISKNIQSDQNLNNGQKFILGQNSIFVPSCQSSQTNYKQPTQIKFCQYTSSLHTSNYSFGTSSQNMFCSLKQKVKKSSTFANKLILVYCIIILVCFIIMAITLIIEQEVQKSFIDDYDDHSKQSIRFFVKFSSLTLINSRIINIDENPSNTNIPYQIQRGIIQMRRIKDGIFDQHIDLWLETDWGRLPVLQRLMHIQDDDSPLSEILYEQYLTFFQFYIKLLYQRHILKKPNIQIGSQRQLIQANQHYLQQYVESNLQILRTNIQDDIFTSLIISRCVFSIFTAIIIFIGFMGLKFKEIQQKHNQEVLNVFLSISDKNCEKCVDYFRLINSKFSTNVQIAAQTSNQAHKIQTYMNNSNQLVGFLQQIQIEPDKFYRKKSITKIFSDNQKKPKIFIIFIVVLIIGSLAIKLTRQQNHNFSSIQFLKQFFKLIDYQKNLIYKFLRTKEIIFNQPYITNSTAILKNIKAQFQQHSTNGTGFTKIFMKLMALGLQFQPNNQQFIDASQKFICDKIKNADINFYNTVCLNTTKYFYHRFKLFQIHSVIQSSIYDIACSLMLNSSTKQQNIKKIDLVEEAINLQYIFINIFFDDFREVINYYHQSTIFQLRIISSVFVIIFILLTILMVYYAHIISKNMGNNCGKILVVPQIVLKNTKGALRHIDNVLRAIV